jgi:hypothetical protein
MKMPAMAFTCTMAELSLMRRIKRRFCGQSDRPGHGVLVAAFSQSHSHDTRQSNLCT